MYNRGTRRLALKTRIPLRFGARSLLLLTMVVAAYLTWRLQNQETRAKRVIESLGGYAFCVGKVQMINGFKVSSLRAGLESLRDVVLIVDGPVDSGSAWRAAELRLPSNIRVNFTNKFQTLKP